MPYSVGWVVADMKANFKFLCYTQQACPSVKAGLKEMGFKSIRDAPAGEPFDIYASRELTNMQHENKIVEEIIEQFEEKIHTIQIRTV